MGAEAAAGSRQSLWPDVRRIPRFCTLLGEDCTLQSLGVMGEGNRWQRQSHGVIGEAAVAVGRTFGRMCAESLDSAHFSVRTAHRSRSV